MDKQMFTQIFFMAVGAFSILGAIFQWNFFFNSRKAKRLTGIIGIKGARIFYIVIGLGLFLLGFLDMIHVIDVHLLLGRRHRL